MFWIVGPECKNKCLGIGVVSGEVHHRQSVASCGVIGNPIDPPIHHFVNAVTGKIHLGTLDCRLPTRTGEHGCPMADQVRITLSRLNCSTKDPTRIGRICDRFPKHGYVEPVDIESGLSKCLVPYCKLVFGCQLPLRVPEALVQAIGMACPLHNAPRQNTFVVNIDRVETALQRLSDLQNK